MILLSRNIIQLLKQNTETILLFIDASYKAGFCIVEFASIYAKTREQNSIQVVGLKPPMCRPKFPAGKRNRNSLSN